jgi:hypothetical protein
VRGRGDDRQRPDRKLPADLVLDGTYQLAGHHQLAEDRVGDAQAAQDALLPGLAVLVAEQGHGRIGVLRAGPPGEQVVQQVGDHEHPAALAHLRGVVALEGVELVQAHDLDRRAGAQLEQLAAGKLPVQQRRAVVTGLVPVGHGVAQQLPVLVDEAEVAAPGVDGQRNDVRVLAQAGLDAEFELRGQAQDIPVQRAGGDHGPVVEPVGHIHLHPRAVEGGDGRPAIARPEVEDEVVLRCHLLPLCGLRTARWSCAGCRFRRQQRCRKEKGDRARRRRCPRV